MNIGFQTSGLSGFTRVAYLWRRHASAVLWIAMAALLPTACSDDAEQSVPQANGHTAVIYLNFKTGASKQAAEMNTSQSSETLAPLTRAIEEKEINTDIILYAQWEKLQNRFSTYLEINKKDWSEEFKSKSKQAYDRFKEQGEELSVHALSRLPRLNKPGYEVIHEEDVLGLIKTMPNYSEGEEKMIWFSPSKQLVVVKNKNSGDIVSIVRRKNKKEEWTDAGL